MPRCSTRPPAASSAAGMTSRRSAMAEAPKTRTRSLAGATSRSAAVSAAAAWGMRRSTVIAAPAGARRSVVTRSVLSMTLSASPGSSVEITATRRRTKGATRTSGGPAQASATRPPGAA